MMADNPTENGNGETESDAGAAGPAEAAQNGEAPSMRIVAQYLKDLSFENPNAPESLAGNAPPPKVDISVNVNAKTLSDTDFEVELQLEAKAENDDKLAFAAEMVYCGLFRIEGLPKEALHQVVLIECPRVLFPFARQIMAHATQQGGFPPLMLDPIDFAGMYQQRAAAEQASA